MSSSVDISLRLAGSGFEFALNCASRTSNCVGVVRLRCLILSDPTSGSLRDRGGVPTNGSKYWAVSPTDEANEDRELPLLRACAGDLDGSAGACPDCDDGGSWLGNTGALDGSTGGSGIDGNGWWPGKNAGVEVDA